MTEQNISMFDGLTSANIAAYWQTRQQQEAPYLGEILFPNTKQTNSLVEFYKGMTQSPRPLAPSSLDAQAIVRDRQGFAKVQAEAKFFKEAKYIDENLRRELSNLQGSNDTTRRQIVMERIFDDSSELLRGAALQREIVRMQLLTTGRFSVQGNGLTVTEDYKMATGHQAKARGNNWGQSGSDPFADIDQAIYTIGTDTGITIERAIMNRTTFRTLQANETVKSTLLANNSNTAAVSLPKSALLDYLQGELDVQVQVYDKGYQNLATGTFEKFIPDGMVVFIPVGELGRTVFTSTPEETDLALSGAADVSIVDTGVTVTTSTKVDPVTKETKVTQSFIPSFEQIDSVYILDTAHYTGK